MSKKDVGLGHHTSQVETETSGILVTFDEGNVGKGESIKISPKFVSLWLPCRVML